MKLSSNRSTEVKSTRSCLTGLTKHERQYYYSISAFSSIAWRDRAAHTSSPAMSNQPIANCDTPDPWLIASPLNPNTFYLTFTLGNRIELWSSSNLESFHNATRSTIWQPPPGSPWSAEIWAPELHYLFGSWYVYAAGAPPDQGNKGHRTIVLRSNSQDPMDASAWMFEGPLRGLPQDQWSIDATVFSIDHGQPGMKDQQRRWYVCYSGWPLGDQSDTQQDLFLAKLANPLEVEHGSLVCISKAELEWERPDGGKRGVNEGPTWVDFSQQRQNGWRGIIYSAHGSWTCEYKLAILQYTGGDPCNPGSWRKRPYPLLVSDKRHGGPFGPGHASFLNSPYNDGNVFCVYHGTERDDEGWNNRKGRIISMNEQVFHVQGQTMCCAYSICPGMQGHQGVHGQQAGVYPGQQHQSQSQQPQQPSGGQFEKYLGRVEKKIPAQYQGYFNKAKKLFK